MKNDNNMALTHANANPTKYIKPSFLYDFALVSSSFKHFLQCVELIIIAQWTIVCNVSCEVPYVPSANNIHTLTFCLLLS